MQLTMLVATTLSSIRSDKTRLKIHHKKQEPPSVKTLKTVLVVLWVKP